MLNHPSYKEPTYTYMFKLSALLITVSVAIQAQGISGKVYSNADTTEVQFANVVLLDLSDSVFVTGVLTYLEGEFKIPPQDTGRYLLKISSLGYKNLWYPVHIKKADNNINLGTLYLKTQNELIDEVKVTGQMIRGKELVDRTVYEIPPEIEKSSTTGYDILKKIPAVQVDFNNNITIGGKRNFIIEIDGKQRDAEYLNRVMPEDIESVEVIHNPSGRYEGTIDAVLVIKLKPAARMGVSGNMGVMGKPYGNTTAAINGGIDYGFEKVTFYVSGFSFIQNLDNKTRTLNKYLFTQPDSVVEQLGRGNFGIRASSVNAGFDYYLNKKNSLSINYNYKPTQLKNELVHEGEIMKYGSLLNTNISKTNTDNSSKESNVSLFYRHEFEKPIQELTSENSYYVFNATDNNTFRNTFYELNGAPYDTFTRNEISVNQRTYVSSKWNYVHPLGMSARIESGLQLYHQTMDYDFTGPDTLQNNNYNYAEWRNAAYSGITYNKKKIGMQLNLRLEYSSIDINNSAPDGYFVWLPSANIQYKFSSSHNLKLTYNRRINRPGIYNLNPNIRYNTNNTFSTGNPQLKPEYRNLIQLTYTANIGKSFVSPHVYYEILTNKTGTRNYTDISPISGRAAIFSQPQNLLSGYEAGMGVSGFIKFVYLEGMLFKGHFNKYTDALSHIDSKDYYSYRITNYYTAPLFNEKLNVFAFLNYQGVTVDAQSKTYHPFIYGFGGNTKVKEDHTFGLFYMLPFNQNLKYNKSIVSTDLLYTENISTFDVNYFIQLQYHYKFNKGRAVKKIAKKVELESDTKSGGIR